MLGLVLTAALIVLPQQHPADRWMRSHPRAAEHATWRDSSGTMPYGRWPSGMRERLFEIFDDLRAGRPAPMADPLPNAGTSGPPDRSHAEEFLTPQVARDVYLSFVAQTLLIEIERRVPWSIAGYSDESLEALLASRAFFYWQPERGLYQITMFDHGFATPTPPAVAFTFLRDNGILAASRRDTIVNLVAWSARLAHFTGDYERSNVFDHWQYDGAMPVSRLIERTAYTGQSEAAFWKDERRHFTAGCHGTAGFFLNVLRAVNIPVILRGTGGTRTHATMAFPADDRAMTHGDDPYTRTTNPVGAADRLVDRATYERWLGPLAPTPERYVGYQVTQTDERISRERGVVRAIAPPADAKADVPAAPSNWIEAESVSPRGPGVIETQDMSAFAGAWHGTKQVLWHQAKVGDQLSLPFDVAIDNASALDIAFTKAADYAIVSVALDGQVLRGADRVSLFSADVTPFELSLADLKITRGRHTLVVTILGHDPLAAPALMVGIDAIRIR